MDEKISERSLLAVLDQLPEAVALLDRQARIRYVNSAAERLVGKSRAALLSQVAWNVAADPIGPALRAAFDRVLAGEEVLILRSYFAQGRWHEIVAHPERDEIVLFGRDITERLAEALRRQTEERFRILVDSVKDYAIVMLDPKGRIASWNGGAERTFGYRASEILGQAHTVFYPREDAARARHNLEAAVAHGHDEDNGWLLRKNGARFRADCFFYPSYDQLGEPTGFAVVTRDVTEHRLMEESLRESEERLRLATDAAEVGIWEYFGETHRLHPDARVVALVGLTPEMAARYTREDMISLVHPADRERVDRAFDRAFAGDSYQVEYRVVSARDGIERWLECRGKLLDVDAGKPARMLGVLRDVTERHRYDEFRQLLPGIIAHDLRSPLSTIKMAGVMLKSAALPASTTRYAEATLRSADQMERMTARLLDFTQARFGGGLPLERTPTALADMCGELVASAHVTWPDCDVHLDVDGDTHGIWDRTRLTEVALNLLGNAIKHGPAGQPIEVVVHGEGDDVVLAIHNGGTPIPSELLPVLFDPFRRAERAERSDRGPKSYGLGLYISHEIVVAHGGRIEVSSSNDAGTTFTVRLPRGSPAPAAPSLSP